MMKVLMLIDYREQFYSSQRASTIGLDLSIVKETFKEQNVSLNILSFNEVDFKQNYEGTYLIYQSSEDKGLLYKSYIADVILGLEERGAKLIPSYSLFHAHHNKSYQEILREMMDIPGLVNIYSKSFGCLEEFNKFDKSNISYPIVLKSSEGCRSKSVSLAHNQDELERNIKKISSSFDLLDALRFFAKRYLRNNYIPESINRNKFILQEFVPDLEGDYKILIYGDKYYVLSRSNRKGDFRASGSGLFTFPEELPSDIFEVSRAIKNHFNVPYISLDIAYNPETKLCYLIEFQFLMFGTFTLESSDWYFMQKENKWIRIKEKSVLEKVFSETLISFINQKLIKNISQ